VFEAKISEAFVKKKNCSLTGGGEPNTGNKVINYKDNYKFSGVFGVGNLNFWLLF